MITARNMSDKNVRLKEARHAVILISSYISKYLVLKVLKKLINL